MTCREKLQKEHPEMISEDFLGGCNGCPCFYGYTDDSCLAALRGGPNEKDCAKCWNRETGEPIEEKPAPRATVYISGPITGIENYWEAFERAEDELAGKGWVVLTPSRHPTGLTNAQYMRMDLAMIDSADAVYFLPGWDKSKGARLEWQYCEYIGKPHADSLDTFGEVTR